MQRIRGRNRYHLHRIRKQEELAGREQQTCFNNSRKKSNRRRQKKKGRRGNKKKNKRRKNALNRHPKETILPSTYGSKQRLTSST